MKVQQLIVSATIMLLVSCGGESDFGSGRIGEFDTVLLYVTDVNPQPLQSDVVYKVPIVLNVNSVDPTVEIIGDGIGDDDGVCEVGETCCSDIGPGNPAFQSQCCVGTTQVELCLGSQFVDDIVEVGFVVEPKRNASGDPIFPTSSPVIIESVDIIFYSKTQNCVDLPSRNEYINLTIQPDFVPPVEPDKDVTYFALSVISQNIKSLIFSSMAIPSNINYVNEDGCITPIQVYLFNNQCEYIAKLQFHAIELYSGDAEVIPVDLSIRIADYQDQEECRIQGF